MRMGGHPHFIPMAGFSLGRDPYLLGRQGLAGALRIGVRNENTRIAAHAWVAVDGIPVNDSEEIVAHFAVFTGPFLTPLNSTSCCP